MSSGGWIITWILTILCLETPLLQVSLDTPTSGISSLMKIQTVELFLCHNIVGVRCNQLWHKPGYWRFWKKSWSSFLHCTCTLKKRMNHLKIVIDGILPHGDCSFELQSGTCVWTSATPIAAVTLSFTYPHILTLLTSNSLLMIAWLASSVIQLSLTYPHIPDEAQMNKWSSGFIREVSFRLIFVFEGLSCNILWFSKPDKDNS